MGKRRVAVLGSTGSIGVQALEVISGSGNLELHSIVCGKNLELLEKQIREYSPSVAGAVTAKGDLPPGVLSGSEVLEHAIDGADVVLNAIVGSAGLKASILCMEKKVLLALANKESLVIGGELLKDFVASGGVIPVDSEHSTIYRCLEGEKGVLGITLTASGGPVRDVPLEKIPGLPVERILNHPTWDMGARITVDSATMVNKAFEVIEAKWLFEGLPIEVVVHPQSVVHSLVRLADGSWKALAGRPDMRIPIQYGLNRGAALEILAYDRPVEWDVLSFEPLEVKRYPAFETVVDAGERGGTCPAVANAADEVAVEAFLSGRIEFGDIAMVIRKVLDRHRRLDVGSVEEILEADGNARIEARKVVEELC